MATAATVATVDAGTPIPEVAARLAQTDDGAVVVLAGDRPVGVITERLLLRAVGLGLPSDTRADDLCATLPGAVAPAPASEPSARAPVPRQPRATAGDRLVIRRRALGQPDRDAEILDVRGPNGGPPYLVRWSDTGHEGLLYPGPDARIAQPEPA
jgi:hypothetical protein